MTERSPGPLWPVILVAALGGLCAGLPFALHTSKVPVLAGFLAMMSAFMLGTRHGARGVGLAIAGAAIAATVGIVGGAGWVQLQSGKTARDTSKDEEIATLGRITRATIGRSYEDQHFTSADDYTTKYCSRIEFTMKTDGGIQEVKAERCDLSKRLWQFLRGREYQGIDIVYIPGDVEWQDRGTPLDYRYDQELPPRQLEELRARCDDPDDYACQPPQP